VNVRDAAPLLDWLMLLFRRTTTTAIVIASLLTGGCDKAPDELVSPRRDAGAPTDTATTSASASGAATLPPLDETSWRRVSELGADCAVYLAREPRRAVRKLDFTPCGDGCRRFVADWSDDPNAFIGRGALRLGDAAFVVSKRRHRAAGSEQVMREIHVVDRVDDGAVFAMAIDRPEQSSCTFEITVGEPGIVASVIPRRGFLEWAWIGIASWDRPSEPKWTAIPPKTLGDLRVTEDLYFVPHAFVPSGVWLDDDKGARLYQPETGALVMPTGPDSKAIALHGYASTGRDVLAFASTDAGLPKAFGRLDDKARFTPLRSLTGEPELRALAVDGSRASAPVWLEAHRGSKVDLYSATLPSAAAALAPRLVTSFPNFSGGIAGDMVADAGWVAFVRGMFAREPTTLYVIDRRNGRTWKPKAPDARRWTGAAGFSDGELWVWTRPQSPSGKLLGPPGLVRLRLPAGLGAPVAR
jgi:hypothetical protein